MAPHRNPPARPLPRLTSISRAGINVLYVREIRTLLSDGGVTVPAATKPKLVQLLLDNEEVCIPAAIRPRSAPKTTTADASILTRLTDMETQLKLVYPRLDALEAAATPNKRDDQVAPKPSVPKSKLPRLIRPPQALAPNPPRQRGRRRLQPLRPPWPHAPSVPREPQRGQDQDGQGWKQPASLVSAPQRTLSQLK